MPRLFTTGFSKAVTLILLSCFSALVLAQSTTSAIRGKLLDTNGDPLANADVVVLDTRTGATRTVSSNDSGTFFAPNLVVGGPFIVTVNNEKSVKVDSVALGDVYRLTVTDLAIAGSAPASDIEEITVMGAAVTFADVASGPSAVFTLADLEDAVAFNRDIKDVFSNDPRINLDNPERGSGVNCGGKNPRFNGISIDGVSQADRFGLNENGFATANGQPFPFDAIAQVSVELAPFDVTYGGFSACSINAVTKSGQNDFFGSAFYEFSNDSLRGDEINTAGRTFDVDSGPFTEKTFGFDLGGALIKDKLFFYGSFEKADSPRFNGIGFDGSGNGIERPWLSESDYNRIVDIANRVYGYDPGGQPENSSNDQEKILARIDWDINDNHRASFIYNNFSGNEVRLSDSFNRTNTFEFNNHTYNKGSDLDTYIVKLNSNWSDNFSSELFLSRNELDDTQQTIANPEFGEFSINIGNNRVFLGADDSRQANDLNYSSDLIKLNLQYLAGNHVITAGFERDVLDVFNIFVQHSRGGEYRISDNSGRGGLSGIDAFEQGRISRAYYGSAGVTNNASDAAAVFENTQTTLYLQDEYTFDNIDLTIVGGLRYERFSTDDAPAFNQAFTDSNGFVNNATIDGVDLVMPRVGFTWNANDDLTVRGGVGLFSGGNPNVWISNSYSNDGITNVQINTRFNDSRNPELSLFTAPLSGQGRPGFDPLLSQFNFVANTTAADANTSNLSLVDPNYEQPSELKFALGATVDVFDGYTLDADLLYSKQRDSAIYRDVAQRQLGTTAVGSPIIGNVNGGNNFVLTNSDRDADALVLSASINKSFDNGIDFTLGYAYTDAEDISPMTSSTAGSNFNNVATLNPNDLTAATSDYETQNRFTFRFNYRTELIADLTTSISVYGFYKDGQSTSYTMSGEGLEGNNFNRRHLLYVPNANDNNVIFADGFDRASFDQFIADESLARGSFVGRNTVGSRSSGRIDLAINQDLPEISGLKPRLYFKMNNVLNFLNNDWGAQFDNAFVSEDAVESSVNDAGQFVYERFNSTSPTDILPNSSVWSARVGIEVNF